MPAKILILYLEFAEYTLATVRAMLALGAEVHLVQYPIQSEAPYKFNFPAELKIYQRFEYTNDQLLELAKDINPDLIISGGWTDSGYLRIAKHFFGKIPTIVGMDTQFKNTPKQWLAIALSRFTLLKRFSYMCGGGKLQYEYAAMLGFKKQNMLPTYYSADYNHFSDIYQKNLPQKAQHFPKKFIYVGRYLELKGLLDLWQAFTELQNEAPNEWELWCLGAGTLVPPPNLHQNIKHFGFVQPSDLGGYMAQTGVFVQPAYFEPWSVATHEFAIAGFPLICSNAVGAIHSFIKPNENGYVFEARNIQSLKTEMKKMMQKTDAELQSMAAISHQLGSTLTPQIAAQAFYDLATGKK